MSGHVFVVRGDLTRLACDGWLLPSDERLSLVPSWLGGTGSPTAVQRELLKSFAPMLGGYLGNPAHVKMSERFSPDGERVAEILDWPDALPRPWPTNTGSHRGTDPAWYMQSVDEFLDRVGPEVLRRPPRNGRQKPLLALPAVGTGHGGARASTAEILRLLLARLSAWVRDREVDVALVTHDAGAFAAAQAARPRGPWPELAPHEAMAERLAAYAVQGKLVLFLGAGVSMAAGLPSWGQLLDQLAIDLGLTHERASLERLDFLDRAQILERKAGGRAAIRQRIAARLDQDSHALSHALLAALPVDEIITQNYDRLFELAAEPIGPLAIIPGVHPEHAARWLLKLHGSLERPDEIVLTREDYLRYDDRRSALGGIVQALLMTKHMLFVGFSLEDVNFHRIIDDVRKALRPTEGPAARRFGTALLVEPDELRRSLWEDDLELHAMRAPPADPDAAGDSDGNGFVAAARRLEIFLDQLLWKSTTSAAYLLDRNYEHALSDAEKDLRAALEKIASDRDRYRASPAWPHVRALLEHLGASLPKDE